MYILKIGQCWIADWEGDPGRTTVRESAKVFATKKEAQKGIAKAKLSHPFKNFDYQIEEI